MTSDFDNNATNDSPDEPTPSMDPTAGHAAPELAGPSPTGNEEAAPATEPEPLEETAPDGEAVVLDADEEDEDELVNDELFDNDFDEDVDEGAPLADEYRPEGDEDEESPDEEDLDEEDLEEEAEDEELSDAADDILAPDPAGVDEPDTDRGISAGAIEPAASRLHGTLLFVGTPIGNKEDITYRGHRALQNADVVVCEEYKVGARVLRDLNVSKKLIEMNEHNEEEASEEIIGLLRLGKKVAVISDAGLPLIADPGSILMRKVLALGGQPVVVPGVSSIMTALMMSGFDLRTFDYVGFLPRKPEERQAALQDLAARHRTVVLLETPYRLRSLLAGLSAEMPDRQATLAVNLTTPFEAVIRGTLREIAERFAERKFKGEFVMVLAPTFTRTERKAAAPGERGDADAGEELPRGGYAPVRMRPTGEGHERGARAPRFGRHEAGERPGRESGEIRRFQGREERREHGERPAWQERAERGERPGRGERPDRGEHPGRGERPAWQERAERGERPGRGERPDRGERPGRGERSGPGGRFEGRGGSSRFEGRGGSSRFEGRGGSSRFEGRGGSSRFEGRGGTDRPRFEERGDAERPRFEGRGGTDRPSRGDWTPRRSSYQGGHERGTDESRGGGYRGGDRPRGEGRGDRDSGGRGFGGHGFGGRGSGGRGPGRPGKGGPRGGSGKGGRRPR